MTVVKEHLGETLMAVMLNSQFVSPFQIVVFRIADQRGNRAAAQAAGSAEEVRVRDVAVFRHSWLQRLLRGSRGLARCHENRSDA